MICLIDLMYTVHHIIEFYKSVLRWQRKLGFPIFVPRGLLSCIVRLQTRVTPSCSLQTGENQSCQRFLTLTSKCRAIGQSEMTADYIKSLSEGRFKMPQGPVLLQVFKLHQDHIVVLGVHIKVSVECQLSGI